MATRSSIGIMDKSGKILSIYAHSDGYPSYMGKILTTFYNDANKVKQLIKMGYASQIGETLEASEATKRFGFSPIFLDEFGALPEDEKKRLSDEHYSDKYSVFYKRDRGETGVDANLSNNLTEWITQQGQAYNYVFYKGKWYAYDIETPIDIVTEEVVTEHPLPNIQKAKQVTKEKIIKYTWENADTHMRSILKMQKESNYPEYGIQVFVTPTEVKIQHLEHYVSNYRKRVFLQDTNKLVILTIPTNQFYRETKTSNTPKSQTMEVIRTILYQHINIALEEFTK